MAINKLDIAQREKSGSETFSKYDYQYHWALYKAISMTQQQTDYVILIEMHEDVVVGDSLDGDKVKYDFNQVKTVDNKYTAKNLVRRQKGENDELKPSVLAKLISYQNRFEHPEEVINNYNLVAYNGFSFALKNEEKRNYERIDLNDLQDSEVTILSEAIKSELTLDSLPANLHFITSSIQLPEVKFQDSIIGYITRVMDELFGTSHGAESVYRALIDEFHRKGQVSLDFKNWEDLKDNKGITSITVDRVIKQFTDQFSQSDFQKSVDDYLLEIKISAPRKITVKRFITKYLTERNDVGCASYVISKEIAKMITDILEEDIDCDTKTIIGKIWDVMNEDYKNLFENQDSPKLLAWVITESIYYIQNGTD